MASPTPAEPGRPFVEGPLCIDLLNTTWRSNGETVDFLATREGVSEFSTANNHPLSPAASRHAQHNLINAREVIRQLFMGGDPTEELDDVLDEARVTRSHDGTGITITGNSPENALSIEAVVNAIEEFQTRKTRIRSCAHDDCVLWFLDTSKGGRRRWCSMERCGNRAKARRHYQRTATTN